MKVTALEPGRRGPGLETRQLRVPQLPLEAEQTRLVDTAAGEKYESKSAGDVKGTSAGAGQAVAFRIMIEDWEQGALRE